MDIGAEEIRRWHVQDNGWNDIGYHYVIRRNGVVEKGRNEAVAGAHTSGHNFDSIGVCLVGGMKQDEQKPDCNFTGAQFIALAGLIRDMRKRYPNITVSGHRDWAKRDCPTFNAEEFASWL
jgi:N-acetyl-anhydromuramyl-L-alanine amidase AmpD